MPNATQICIREVLAKFDADFASTAQAAENGEYALWVGSGISRQAPSLGGLIERAFEFLRQRAIDPAFAAEFAPALDEAVTLSGFDPVQLQPQCGAAFATWPEKEEIVDKLWNQYSELLDIRVTGKPSDYILWDAIDIRTAFSAPGPPAATHLCIAVLVMEGAVKTIASSNWDGYIEDAVHRLSNGSPGVLQVVVDPNHLREAPGQAKLLKFHGCVVYAAKEPAVFRKYLTGSRTQITEWPDNAEFKSMVHAVIDVATNQKTMVMGLSIQDFNLQTVFSKAKQVNPWPWPCAPHAPGHVFCGEDITKGQGNVLKIVYGAVYDTAADDIKLASHMRAWAEQVLLALVLRVLAEKLCRLMQALLTSLYLDAWIPAAIASMKDLRDSVADLAVPDRTAFVNAAISFWSRLLAVFRGGRLPATQEIYEVLSSYSPAAVLGDANAAAVGLGRLGLILVALHNGMTNGDWKLKVPADGALASGSITAISSRTGASDRPLFLVKSATEAIALEQNGAFSKGNAVVIHADQAFEMLTLKKSARKPTSAPGRTGRVQTRHVSFGGILSRASDALGLQAQLTADMML